MLNIHNVKKGLVTFILIATTIVSGVLLVGTMLVVAPKTLGPAGVTLWFLMALIFLTCLFTWILYGKSIYEVHDVNLGFIGRRLRNSFVVAGGCVVLLALSSLRTLSLRDSLLIMGSGAIIFFYFSTSDRSRG